ncbi:tail protein X [Variovorax sp. OV700]|uniref:tail protein X n=1 Tax=Variovorax sp. OV700 TaxID=1882826 RepID=UPI0008822058|nr:tail protein X [Variovorax sp. OV700]SDI78447.1 P2-like prophage tail protein X [Variovorax sp. OV700]
MKARAMQGDTVDLLCWRALGTSDIVEATYLLNPGLADHGPVLPTGLLVELATPVAATTRPTVSLWD